ncbi:UTRA domain-containing protein [Rubellimicrobium roseum]|uniref:UTRA domain-containing protein n=1 Tax=Rubellimicrobium roseum TaxID=687525 RepID=A0A5C4NMA6_9RHOB|nr:UTRA domain-containing protein [Rubellimicrobium roseum]TNC74246.1 UTRA domain-containing protein [Rubellimicrobium roseum]
MTGEDNLVQGRPETPSGKSPRATHHERILSELKGRILSREWPPGFRLPFETELADRYGVSRMTMNKVLGQLAREGLLVRRRKLGTFVAAPRAQAAVMEIHDIEAEVRALGLHYAFALDRRELRPATPLECDDARIDPVVGWQVLFVRGVHLGASEPFCLESRIINPLAAPGALDQDFSREGPGRWLLKEIPWTAAEHRIRAVSVHGAEARLLGLRSDEACLEILRRTEIAGTWVTLARQIYPGSRHQLLARFSPGSAEG